MKKTIAKPDDTTRRRGAMLVFVLALLIIVFAMVVLSVDVSFMQLSRSELRAATDAAAKAAAGELSRSNGNKQLAIKAGQDLAALNEVAGAPMKLASSDFEFGQAVYQPDGTWQFQAGATPFTSVRVTGVKSASSASGPVNLFFAPMFGNSVFEPQHVAVASQFKQEVVLAIDRSHSMTFDNSGVNWSYPAGVPNRDLNKDGLINSIDAFLTPPHPTGSRWAQLESAVKSFIAILKQRTIAPRIGLVTWASTLDTNSTEFKYTGRTWAAYTVEQKVLDTNLLETVVETAGDITSTTKVSHADSVLKSIRTLGSSTMAGGTNLSSGLDAALAELVQNGQPDSKKVVILMTDGMWNRGRNPLDAAADAKAQGIIVHTITFLDANSQTDMMQVAEITGGTHYHASNAAELVAVFEELARSLPVALTN